MAFENVICCEREWRGGMRLSEILIIYRISIQIRIWTIFSEIFVLSLSNDHVETVNFSTRFWNPFHFDLQFTFQSSLISAKNDYYIFEYKRLLQIVMRCSYEWSHNH